MGVFVLRSNLKIDRWPINLLSIFRLVAFIMTEKRAASSPPLLLPAKRLCEHEIEGVVSDTGLSSGEVRFVNFFAQCIIGLLVLQHISIWVTVL